MWDYTEKVHEHFLNPQNAGALPDADAIGEVGSLACGDALKLYLKIDTKNIITDARFQTFGCASAIASSSVLTEMIKGLHIDEAMKITNKDIAERLGGLPKEKMHCSVMGQEALEAAIRQFRGETVISHTHDDGQLVCRCFGITDTQIRRAIDENGLKSVEEITHYTKAGGACGDCLEKIAEILSQHPSQLQEVTRPKPMSNIQRMQLVMKTLDEEIRPKLIADNGDIELVDVEGTKVIVRLCGRCAQCPSSQVTMKNLVEASLRQFVDSHITVEEVATR